MDKSDCDDPGDRINAPQNSQAIENLQYTKKVLIEQQSIHFESEAPIVAPVIKIERQSLERSARKSQEYVLPLDAAWEFPRENLKLGKVLGMGNFGKVMQASACGNNGENTTVAVKMVKDDHTDQDMMDLVSEIDIMKTIAITSRGVGAQNLVNLLGVCTQDGPLYVIVEYCKHGNLRDYLRNFNHTNHTPSIKLLLSFGRQVATGMELLSRKKIIHRDLAARNILVAEGYIAKIMDFGLSRDISAKDYYQAKHAAVPIKWLAPEALLKGHFTTQSDVWAFGVLLWEIMTLGANPYPSVPMENLYELLRSGHRMECPDECPSEVYQIMRACWHSNPLLRPGFAKLIQDINKLAFQVPTIGSLEQSQYLQICPSEPPRSPQQISTQSKSTKWNCLCSQFNFQSAIKEHPLVFAIIFMTLTAFTVGIGVGFGLYWQGSASSSEGPCICEEEYLFIVGGSCFTETEVVSLSENETAVPNCLSNLADHKNELYYSAGGPLQYEDNMLPHVCGSGSTHSPYDECWRFMASLNSWEKTSDEIPRDINAAAVTFQEDWGIIMAGGRKNDGDCCSYNVTFTSSGQDFKDLELLSDSSVYFCVTGINSTHIFMTGLGLYDTDTYIYSTWTNQWQSLPPMLTGRRYTGCGVVRLEDGSNSVVVAGGLTPNSDRVDTVEIYLVEVQMWRTANKLPTKISFMAVAQVRNSLYIIGGWDGNSNFDTIYLYNPDDDSWTLLQNRMRCPRRASTAMVVNSTIFGSCTIDKYIF